MSSAPIVDVDTPGESTYVDVGDVRLHAILAGPESGPLAVLLHGFPEFWYCWHEHVREFVNAGYRVVAPDQRGYNLSDKPDAVAAYRPDELAGDVVGLLDALGYDSAHVVGHDWGAMVAWWTALAHPERVNRLVPVNVPHPTVFRRTLDRSWSQRLRSWYALFFQFPRIPVHLARARNWALVVEAMRRSSRPGTFSAVDFERYRTAWERPNAYRSMLNWYRAAARYRDRPPRERVTVPTLVVWGARDRFLLRSMARESVGLCEVGALSLFPDGTHWVHHEEPARVAGRIVDFLRSWREIALLERSEDGSAIYPHGDHLATFLCLRRPDSAWRGTTSTSHTATALRSRSCAFHEQVGRPFSRPSFDAPATQSSCDSSDAADRRSIGPSARRTPLRRHRLTWGQADQPARLNPPTAHRPAWPTSER